MNPAPLVVVIDDDESLRVALVGLLRSCGYVARGFGSAEDFLHGKVDGLACLVTDIQMAGMSGIELKRHLSAQGLDTPTIMITARAGPEVELGAFASGAVCVLKKPFEADALIGCIERALHPPD